jgi:hypothetical protein
LGYEQSEKNVSEVMARLGTYVHVYVAVLHVAVVVALLHVAVVVALLHVQLLLQQTPIVFLRSNKCYHDYITITKIIIPATK